jgi:hypothetical protein
MLAVSVECALCLLGGLCRCIYTVVGLGGSVYECQGCVVKNISVTVFVGPLFVYTFVLLFVYVYMKAVFYVHELALSRVICFLHNIFYFAKVMRII